MQKKTFKMLAILTIIGLLPFFAYAVNDVVINGIVNFA